MVGLKDCARHDYLSYFSIEFYESGYFRFAQNITGVMSFAFYCFLLTYRFFLSPAAVLLVAPNHNYIKNQIIRAT
jgi:hypothetical protein